MEVVCNLRKKELIDILKKELYALYLLVDSTEDFDYLKASAELILKDIEMLPRSI